MEQTRSFKHGILGHVKEGFEPVVHLMERYFEMKYEKNF